MRALSYLAFILGAAAVLYFIVRNLPMATSRTNQTAVTPNENQRDSVAKEKSAYFSAEEISSMVKNLKAAASLPDGPERTQTMTEFIRGDYVGTICEKSERFLNRYCPGSTQCGTMQKLHEAAEDASGQSACLSMPKTKMNTLDLTAGLNPLTALFDAVQTLPDF